MQSDVLQSHLQAMAGGGLVLTTEQLSRCLSMNPKVISRMRQEGRFPIPHKTIGTKIVYSILAVAMYLTSDEPEQKVEPPQPKTQTISPEKRRTASKKAVLPDLSRKMLMRGFLSALEQQKESIEELMLFFDRKIQHDDMQASLIEKPEIKKSTRKSKV
jgi:hypothetical protein